MKHNLASKEEYKMYRAARAWQRKNTFNYVLKYKKENGLYISHKHRDD